VNCPTDGTVLLMSERQGVEIDYCPQCRGVWLDRGELDKILERVQNDGSVAATTQSGPRSDIDARTRSNGHDRTTDHSRASYRKKSSPFEFLGDLFG